MTQQHLVKLGSLDLPCVPGPRFLEIDVHLDRTIITNEVRAALDRKTKCFHLPSEIQSFDQFPLTGEEGFSYVEPWELLSLDDSDVMAGFCKNIGRGGPGRTSADNGHVARSSHGVASGITRDLHSA